MIRFKNFLTEGGLTTTELAKIFATTGELRVTALADKIWGGKSLQLTIGGKKKIKEISYGLKDDEMGTKVTISIKWIWNWNEDEIKVDAYEFDMTAIEEHEEYEGNVANDIEDGNEDIDDNQWFKLMKKWRQLKRKVLYWSLYQ